MNVEQINPKSRYIPIEVIEEYFSEYGVQMAVEENDEYVLNLHIPKSFVAKMIVNKPTADSNLDFSSAVTSKPSISSVVGIFKDVDDKRDYQDMLDEAREERLAKYL